MALEPEKQTRIAHEVAAPPEPMAPSRMPISRFAHALTMAGLMVGGLSLTVSLFQFSHPAGPRPDLPEAARVGGDGGPVGRESMERRRYPRERQLRVDAEKRNFMVLLTDGQREGLTLMADDVEGLATACFDCSVSVDAFVRLGEMKADQAECRVLPQHDALPVRRLRRGEVVPVLRAEGDWRRIIPPHGQPCWIERGWLGEFGPMLPLRSFADLERRPALQDPAE